MAVIVEAKTGGGPSAWWRMRMLGQPILKIGWQVILRKMSKWSLAEVPRR